MKIAYLSIVALVLASLGLGACGSPEFSESRYKGSEVGVAKQIQRCRVIATREITIRDEGSGEAGSLAGAVAGGVLGNALTQNVGKGSGREVAEALGVIGGALVGGAIGQKAGETIGTRKGIEYSILKADGSEITFAQELLQGDRIVNPGETCRLQVSYGVNRVLPAEYLPETVEVPKTTTFAE